MKSLFAHTTEPGQPGFGIAPEALDPVDMTLAMNKFILSMVDAKMLFITKVNEPIISSPAIRMDDTFNAHSTSDNRLQRGSSAIGNDFGINFSVSPEDPKDDCFAKSSTATLAFDSTSAEVTFINFNLARKRRLLLTKLGNPFPDLGEIPVDCVPVQAGYLGNLRGIQIQ